MAPGRPAGNAWNGDSGRRLDLHHILLVRYVIEQITALLHRFRRLAVCWEHRITELHDDAFVSPACRLIY
ncbi:hypothetical protein ACIBL6_19260 [Streptomyces sp. NPDC050400]|uniref:hypothetical protein n=1 Tax=Streptomyces sp. NPDC050400 TaxID=3365610 RepID=UPI0037A3A718